MLLAVIADIHANELAFDAVLRDMARHKPDEVLCLGDLVGYGANPVECVTRVIETGAHVVAGNHDIDSLRDSALVGTQSHARKAQLWTRDQLGAEQIDFLDRLPRIRITPQYVGVHGCYLNTSYYSGYVTSTMLGRNLSAIAENVELPLLAFCGHTHATMFGYLRKGKMFEPSCEAQMKWPEGCEAVLINPGSAGQPRDGNAAASYALVDTSERRVSFLRVSYDVTEAAERIRRAGLPDDNAVRLLEGR